MTCGLVDKPDRKMKKKIEEEISSLPEGIIKTSVGDLLVNKVGSDFVNVYNLHKQKDEQYTLKDFAFFCLGKNFQVDILEEAIREAESYFLLLGN